MKTLDERIKAIVEDRSFNDLTFEQREKICKYLTQQQIQTLWQAINLYPNLVCKAYRTKMRSWLKNIVDYYEKEYGGEVQ